MCFFCLNACAGLLFPVYAPLSISIIFLLVFVRCSDGAAAEAVAEAEDAGEQGTPLLPDDATARHLGGELL